MSPATIAAASKDGTLPPDTVQPETWKGFRITALEKRFGISRGLTGIRVPYFDAEGTLHRVKLFPEDDKPVKWLGAKKPQIPYGLWKLPNGGKVLILTEGESDTIAVSAYLPKIPVLGIPGSQSWKPDWKFHTAGFERVFIVGDGDAAGTTFAEGILADLPAARLVLVPPGADTRAILQKLGSRAFVALLTAAEATKRINVAMTAAAGPLASAAAVKDAWER